MDAMHTPLLFTHVHSFINYNDCIHTLTATLSPNLGLTTMTAFTSQSLGLFVSKIINKKNSKIQTNQLHKFGLYDNCATRQAPNGFEIRIVQDKISDCFKVEGQQSQPAIFELLKNFGTVFAFKFRTP